MSAADVIGAFRAAHPQVRVAEVFVPDINGVPRGKLVPMDGLGKLAKGGMKMPLSSVGLDVFGCDVGRSRIALEIGDPDSPLIPIPESLALMDWTDPPAAQVQAMMAETDGSGRIASLDPRGALVRVVDRAAAMGFKAVMALELEFYLIDAKRDEDDRPQPPVSPLTGARLFRNQIYDMNVLRAFETVIADITEACHMLGAPADTAICEFGPGQFEINLLHVDDPLRAADHMVSMKRAVRGVARANGYDATFMAKPYGDAAGSGMHLHLSLEQGGRNIFAEAEAGGPNRAMRHAIAGMIARMADSMLLFAPHYNSYRRFMPGSYAPMVAAWGLDNRGTALRTPEVAGPGARIEHRVAGADANPYLVAAAILASALDGIEAGAEPPPPVRGEAKAGIGEGLPLTWLYAIEEFEGSEFVPRTLGPELARVFAAMKRQELETLLARVTDAEYDAYLRTV